MALVVTFPLESTGLEKKNAKLSPSSCRRNAENAIFPLLLLSSNTHCHTFHQSQIICKFIWQKCSPFSSFSFYYTLLFFYHYPSRYVILRMINFIEKCTIFFSQGSPNFTTIDSVVYGQSPNIHRMSQKKRMKNFAKIINAPINALITSTSFGEIMRA